MRLTCSGDGRDKPNKLGWAVAMEGGNWPTPSAENFEQKDLNALLERRERVKQTAKNGNGFGLTLGNAVRLEGGNWPTPTCADQYTDKLKSSQQKEGSMHSVNLSQAVGMNWATPQRIDEDFIHMRPETARLREGQRQQTVATQVAAIHNGVLNPEWEEPLMSWPIGWTQLEPLPVLNWPFRDRGAFVAKRGLPQHEWEPPRTCGKIPNRNARVKAIGNGQDPSALTLAVRLLTTMKLPFTKAA